jgi:phosphomannomutase
VAQHRADALVSTDGDSDRPLLVDATGAQVRGDVLGILVAQELGADWVATPVSCNTAVERCGSFATVRRTRIGSPYVIAGLAEGLAAGARTVVGYEANGGLLTATPVRIPGGGVLAPLPTRDALLPLLAALHGARRRGQSLAAWRAELPARCTWSGLLRETPPTISQRLMAELRGAPAAVVAARFRPHFGELATSDFTDGARYTFADGTVVHLRPSGNAPEFRCYTEADSEAAARAANDRMLAVLCGEWLPRLAAPGAP